MHNNTPPPGTPPSSPADNQKATPAEPDIAPLYPGRHKIWSLIWSPSHPHRLSKPKEKQPQAPPMHTSASAKPFLPEAPKRHRGRKAAPHELLDATLWRGRIGRGKRWGGSRGWAFLRAGDIRVSVDVDNWMMHGGGKDGRRRRSYSIGLGISGREEHSWHEGMARRTGDEAVSGVSHWAGS